MKNDIKPKPTSCLALKSSLYFVLKSNIEDISTSLKVVNIAVSFLTVTSLSATFLLSIESLVLVSFLSLVMDGEPIDGLELTASSLVTLPSFPDPIILAISKLFSAIIFLADGLAM